MKIAIVRLSALGDIIVSAVFLAAIKECLPNAQIEWFVDERFG
ncbi:lipopolysaccharide heptosyltransferase I, partial [Helicobacter pylori]|nr:lipopolysaccharide heptosyltransferase I [Helicobacter pylori]MBS3013938.1 lipopolysaccharide heptosyltransferase I [Helicobacter pylori]